MALAGGTPISQVNLGSGTAAYAGNPKVVRDPVTPADVAEYQAFNATRPAPPLPTSIAAALRPENTLVVLNKCDLLARADGPGGSGFRPDVSGINPDLQFPNWATTAEVQALWR